MNSTSAWGRTSLLGRVGLVLAVVLLLLPAVARGDAPSVVEFPPVTLNPDEQARMVVLHPLCGAGHGANRSSGPVRLTFDVYIPAQPPGIPDVIRYFFSHRVFREVTPQPGETLVFEFPMRERTNVVILHSAVIGNKSALDRLSPIVELTITDTRPPRIKAYVNPLGKLAPPVQDVSAFATCP